MAQSVKINGVTYDSVPKVEIPLSSGSGNAAYWDTTGATAAADNILTGKTAFGAAGSVTGTMANNGAVTGSISTVAGTYTVPAGYHSGKGTVSIASAEQAKLVTGNIRAGVTVLGVSGKSSVVDTADATASAGTIISGKTAYVNGSKVTGSLTLVSVAQDSASKVLTIA